MKLVLLFGNAAVGKMTVGQELMKRTGLRLFHNHMTIEPVLEVFGDFYSAAIQRCREAIFEEFAKTDRYGMIFTYMWAFDQQSDWDYIQGVARLFEDTGGEVFWVELTAPQEIRLQRNATENRLKNKASKRNLEFSSGCIRREDANYRLVSNEGEIPFENYIKIDNSNLSPEEAAERIVDRFPILREGDAGC